MLLYKKLGRLAQSGRALPLQGRSHRFKSCSAHKGFSVITPRKYHSHAHYTHFLWNNRKMRRFLILVLTIFATCGPSEAEIQERIDLAVSEAITTSTSTSSTSTTTTIPRIKIYETITKTFEDTVNRQPRDNEVEEWLEVGLKINNNEGYDLVNLTLEIKQSLEPEVNAKSVAKMQQDLLSAMFGGDDDD